MRIIGYIKVLTGCLLVGLLLFDIPVACALSPTELHELREQRRRELEQREKVLNTPDIHLGEKLKGEKIKELPIEEISFDIDQIVLVGEQTGRFGWAQELLNQYAGHKIGSEGLDIILNELTDGFIARGYVTTRVQVEEQDLTTGILKITLIPGRVGKIKFADTGQQGSWWTAFPTKPGRILNIRDLEQGLEQMKRVPSQDVQFQISPGENPGESDVIIELKKSRAWRGGFSIDDSGSESTGRYQGSINFSIDNVFQHNDLFSYSYIHDLDKHSKEKSSSSHSYHYSIPYRYWNFSFSAFPSKYRQTVQGLYSSFNMSGESENYVLKAQRVLHRDQDSKFIFDISLGKKFSKSFIEEVEIEAQAKDTSYLEVGLSRRKNFATGLIDMRIAGRRGLRWLGSMEDSEFKYPDMPTYEYFLGTFDFNLMQQFKWDRFQMKYNFDFRGQGTESQVYGSEMFSIGGRYTVRGFDGEYTLSAENGFYIRNELGMPIEKLNLELYGGIDYGQVTGPSAKYLVGNKLAGSAIGLRGSIKGAYYDIFAGFPIYKPEGFESPDVVYGFQVGYQF